MVPGSSLLMDEDLAIFKAGRFNAFFCRIFYREFFVLFLGGCLVFNISMDSSAFWASFLYWLFDVFIDSLDARGPSAGFDCTLFLLPTTRFPLACILFIS